MTSLEIKLIEFKKKNPTVETKEQNAMIEILRFQYVWLHNLEREHDTIKKVSLENNRNNLFLMNKITELENENKKLKLTIENL